MYVNEAPRSKVTEKEMWPWFAVWWVACHHKPRPEPIHFNGDPMKYVKFMGHSDANIGSVAGDQVF